MCFIKERSNDKFKVAKKDITCYKSVRYRTGNKYMYSSIQSFRYIKGKLYTIDVSKKCEWDEEMGLFKINIGFHSFASKSQAFNNRWNNETIVECIIPKGAKYFKNSGDHEYVSDKIKIKKILGIQ